MKWPWPRKREHELAVPERRVSEAVRRREFVYLDEVSVVSLLAARAGTIPETFTDSAGLNSKAELTAQAEVGVAPLKSKVSGRFESARSVNSQVVSKAIVQTLFHELFEHEHEEMALRSSEAKAVLPTVDALRSQLESPQLDDERSDWVVPAASLRRGDLIEVEVELEAEEMFRLSAAFATFIEVAEEAEELRAQIKAGQFEQVSGMAKVVETMMAGLIPLKCRLVDYGMVNAAAGLMIVHRDVAAALGLGGMEPLYLVGHTEKDLYWKDIRRLLFSKSRFHVLCRVSNEGGLRDRWNPMKAADALMRIAPGVGYSMSQFSTLSAAAFAGSSTVPTPIEDRKASALVRYGFLLAETSATTLSGLDQANLRLLGVQHAAAFVSASTIRDAFLPIQAFIERCAGKALDASGLVALRRQACADAGLNVDGTFIESQAVAVSPSKEGKRSERLLETETIAIYW
ncbi:hypothetical protein [Amycolatopsis sp. NPDC051102]|uniref:DUF6414 family protein n=1 Tax=Amycolatopsis sp. NPDC051102 TaxID=3155163 RepID=UPI003435D15D